jgi:hypothetical protein
MNHKNANPSKEKGEEKKNESLFLNYFKLKIYIPAKASIQFRLRLISDRLR